MDEVDHIIAEILTERKHSASKTSLLLETKKLREAWDALNAWILDRVIQRRGAAVPNFGKFTWQVLGGFTPADLDPRLAGKKAASKIPPARNEADLVKCGDLDYSNLALRYSSHLTKDMVFAALRDVTRRVGEKIASGFALRVKMSVGSSSASTASAASSSTRRPWPRARARRGAAAPTRRGGRGAPGTVAASRPASEDKSDDAGDGGDEPLPVIPPPKPYAFTSSTFYSTPADEYEHPDTPAEYHSSVLAKTNGEIMRDSTDALLGMLPTKNHLKPSATYYRRDRDRASRCSELNDKCKTTGLLQAESSVADAAYERHLASIEHEANRIQDEKVVFQNLLAEGYAADAEKRKNWKRANLELQEYLQNQIDTKAVKHAREGDPEDELKEQEALGAIVTKSLEASKGKTSDLRTAPLGGTRPSRVAQAAHAAHARGPFKMYNITGFPTRGRAENIKVHELCDELARSIDCRKERVKSEREEVLEEERRFIRHVNDEMFKNKTLAKQKLDAANAELLRAWETSHAKNLQRLQGFARRDAELRQSFTYLCVETGHFRGARRATNAGDSMIVQQTPDVLGIIFSVFASNTFTGLYEQQELAHVAVYAEVSVARTPRAIGARARRAAERGAAALAAYGRYLADLRLDVGDPRRGPPRGSTSARPRRGGRRSGRGPPGPAEELLYATSVGLPSPHVYATVRTCAPRGRGASAPSSGSCRACSSACSTLGASLLSSFVITVAGYAPGANLAMEKWGFAVLAFALVTCLRVLEDIWSPTSGA
ncbi:DUF4496-containing protein [Aureococcus anophagefferens]|nr:DUF4496-containing protein [Aureococcus anophagefferens]